MSLEVIEIDAQSVIAGRVAGVEISRRANRPDAIFAGNDLVAMGVLQALMMQGMDIAVPGEIALIGYDDIDFASAAVVPLSSIRQPATLIGATAVDILLEEAGNPAIPARQIEFQPELIVRASTSARDSRAARPRRMGSPSASVLLGGGLDNAWTAYTLSECTQSLPLSLGLSTTEPQHPTSQNGVKISAV
jgi:hypothetical protein